MERLQSSPESFRHSEYKLLTAENYLDLITERQGVQPTDTIARGDSEGMRAKYIENTERLLDTIRTGFQGESGSDHAYADAVFYLDKSARPVSWLVRGFWQVFPPEHNEPEPDTHYVNLHAQEGEAGSRPEPIDMRHMVEDGVYDRYIQTMQEVFPEMAGKNILVVDEVSVSGSTEELAYQIFRRAFPDAHIKSAAWMQAGKRQDRQGNSYPTEIPVWYKKTSDSGRGVSSIRPELSSESQSAAQRSGAEILSTRPDEPDIEAAQLRREIQQLAHDVVDGHQSIIPAHDPDAPRYEGKKIRQVEQRSAEQPRSLFS